jgi:hypothetical protein
MTSAKHQVSADDERFRIDFEACAVDAATFDHRGHVRLAYTYLVDHDDERAFAAMRTALFGFIRCNGVDPTKYHETITRAWILAVRHFMVRTPPMPSADAFIEANPILLDSKIMLSHYSAGLLFSPEARERFVEPDLSPIPRH